MLTIRNVTLLKLPIRPLDITNRPARALNTGTRVSVNQFGLPPLFVYQTTTRNLYHFVIISLLDKFLKFSNYFVRYNKYHILTPRLTIPVSDEHSVLSPTNASVDIIFLGLIICTVTLTAMCYLYIIVFTICLTTRCRYVQH